jgi:hypothetical protein
MIKDKDIPRAVNATLDRIAMDLGRASIFATAVLDWAKRHAPGRLDLLLLYISYKSGGISFGFRDPITTVKNLLDKWEIEALSTLWDPGWGPSMPSGKKWTFVRPDGSPRESTPTITRIVLDKATLEPTPSQDNRAEDEKPCL